MSGLLGDQSKGLHIDDPMGKTAFEPGKTAMERVARAVYIALNLDFSAIGKVRIDLYLGSRACCGCSGNDGKSECQHLCALK